MNSQSTYSRTSVLLIAMANSVHTARWLQQFKDLPYDVTLVPSTASRSIHPQILELRDEHTELSLTIPRFFQVVAFPVGILDIAFSQHLMALFIRIWFKLSRRSFDVVHAMELQHAGYTLLASGLAKSMRRVVVSNWGSDIYWFRRFPRHRRRITRLLRLSTHYSCECDRDVEIARSLGFSGTVLPVVPNAGPISEIGLAGGVSAPKTSSRKLVLVKGYTGFVGRADIALAAIRKCSAELSGFEVIVYSSDRRSRSIAKKISKECSVSIRALRKYEMSHNQMLELFQSARVYLGISMSDGISTSLLEALASGAFPIQSDTSCADEWIEDGQNGFIVPWDNVDRITERLRQSLVDDVLVDSAAELNLEISRNRLSAGAFEGVYDSVYEFRT